MGDCLMMCKCGSRHFSLSVTPKIENDTPKATLSCIVCINCLHKIEARVDGLIQADGELGHESVRHYEHDRYQSTFSDLT